ncbi:helix-turn-helix domain-containing protein [Pedobacter miscanthi]|uniref:helix-turn-helix domain-containing protein n=1 Tax=Pedobacter miscanthi TaxID=2259170 RepID=UPI00292CCE7E|nr:helix-turn-helix domain-containing protein [Pedobacter miscanthi]
MKKPAITLHQDELGPLEVDVISIKALENWEGTAHRDDHYMFVIQQDGSFVFEVDFKQVQLSGPALSFVSPGQVHRYINFENSKGWLVFVGTQLVGGSGRDVLNAYLNLHQSAIIKREFAVFKLLEVIEDLLEVGSIPLKESLISSIIETFIGLVASAILSTQHSANLIGGRKYRTAFGFKQLVAKKFREVKQVKAYADLLHITPLYLNEVTREITGFTASHWINEEIMLEAKRMLFYTALDVKQIAYGLGFEDHTYFSRFFKKHSGISALTFRNEKPLFVQS